MWHQSLRIEHIKDGHMVSLHFPLLFPQGELGSHLADPYHGDATSPNNRVSCRNFAAYRLHQAQWILLALFAATLNLSAFSTLITEISVHS